MVFKLWFQWKRVGIKLSSIIGQMRSWSEFKGQSWTFHGLGVVKSFTEFLRMRSETNGVAIGGAKGACTTCFLEKFLKIFENSNFLN